MAARSAEVEELSGGQKFTKYLYFEAYLAKFKASTYTKFTKDDRRTIAVTNKRLDTGQTPFREDLKTLKKSIRRHNGAIVVNPQSTPGRDLLATSERTAYLVFSLT